MNVTRYALLLDGFEVEAEIGIHDFERERPQRVSIRVELEMEPAAMPDRDDIADALDYDWLRIEVKRLVASRRFELQETLARAILDIIATRPQVRRAVVETAKPDVYPDARSVGCRLEATR